MKLNKVFEILSGNGVYTEAYLVTHHGEYPVLSGKTIHNGIFGYIDHYDYDLPMCLSYSKDGEHSGTIFLQEGKLSLTSHVNILKLRDSYSKGVDLKWFKYKYEPIFKSMVRGKFGVPSLPSEIVNQIDIFIPSKEQQEEELACFMRKESLQRNLESAILYVDNKIKDLSQLVIEVKDGKKVSGGKLIKPLPKNSGLTEKFLYDYSDPSHPEQIAIYNGATKPSGYLPTYALSEIKKKLIIYKKGDAILIVRKGVKAGTIFVPQEEKFIVGEDIVAINFSDEFVNEIDARWFVREFYKYFKLNTTGEDGSATFALMKMNKMDFLIPDISIQKIMVRKYEEVDKYINELNILRDYLQLKFNFLKNITLF